MGGGPVRGTSLPHKSQPTSSGISGWWEPAEVTCPGRTVITPHPLAGPRVASGSLEKVCEPGTLPLAADLLSLRPRALLCIKLRPRCFRWLKLRKPQPGPFPVLHTKLSQPSLAQHGDVQILPLPCVLRAVLQQLKCAVCNLFRASQRPWGSLVS